MNILLTAATSYELGNIKEFLESTGEMVSEHVFKLGLHKVSLLVTGIGGVQTAFNIAKFKEISTIDACINLGIAGSFKQEISIGTVVRVEKDCFADLGVEEKNGDFKDIFEIGLLDRNHFPFENTWLLPYVPIEYFSDLPRVKSVTVNKVTGTSESIKAIISNYNPDIESMEGASFYYACKSLNISCIQIRAISNRVEPRNRESWDINLALTNLSEVVIQFLKSQMETHN
jgi:futalosine hydrolase